MTLYRQLLSGMLLLLIVLIFGVFVVQFQTTKDFLQLQQENELDNTINSVGMALTPTLIKKTWSRQSHLSMRHLTVAFIKQ
ncbi:hypothetical protein [Photobacterium sanguinicancri]|uniref:hypothetical protein n=1 Tax=Photobacterium sanguinicancri TaxID=875932 RepID=UPI001F15236A|nr:hypothetical protein [Photobacterium sanguinicancri]